MADQVDNSALEDGLAQPLLLGLEKTQEDEDGDQECDGSEEPPEESRQPVASIASAYRLLTPSVKVVFDFQFPTSKYNSRTLTKLELMILLLGNF